MAKHTWFVDNVLLFTWHPYSCCRCKLASVTAKSFPFRSYSDGSTMAVVADIISTNHISKE